MPKVVIYIPVKDARELEAEGTDVAKWTRQMVKFALDHRKKVRDGKSVRQSA